MQYLLQKVFLEQEPAVLTPRVGMATVRMLFFYLAVCLYFYVPCIE